MKRILLLSLGAFFAMSSWSQTQLENPGFEGPWDNVTGAEDEPSQWNGLKTSDDAFLASFAPVTAFQESTNPHTGTRCIRLVVSTTSNANGLLTNGRVHADFNPELGYVFTHASNSDFNYAFSERPDSLVVWVRHTIVSGDKSKVEVLLHEDTQAGKLPDVGVIPHWVGKARIDVIGDMANWTRLSIPFVYYNNNTPDYILAVLSAGDSTQAVPGTTMWVDDIELIYNPNLVEVNPPANQNIDVGVNGSLLTVTETPNSGVTATITREWKFATVSGGPYSSFGPVETGTTYMPNFASTGIYYVVCETDFGTEVIVSNEVEISVTDPLANTVVITPSATQTLLTGQNGNLLTAAETPVAATSREFKYSTTSGSGYVSFAPAVTTSTYTPNFATLGTYYIICESDFAGDVQVSNQVTVIVPSSAGIDQEDLVFKIYASNNIINLVYETSQTDSKFNLFTTSGQLMYSAPIIESNSQYSVEIPQGIYIYQVVSGDQIITGKIKL